MRYKALFAGIVLLEIMAIIALSAYIVRGRTYAISLTPLARDDIAETPAEDLEFFYDLATEKKTAIPDWLPYEVEYLRNSDHLNDRFDYAIEKPPGTYRIITLGDSWAFGMHVSTKDNYSEKLEDLLDRGLKEHSLSCAGIDSFEVLNLGVGGYDIEYMAERLRQRGMKYDPDLILPIIKPDEFVLINELFLRDLRARFDAYDGNLEPHTKDGIAVTPKQEITLQVERDLRAAYAPEDLESHAARALERLGTLHHGAFLLFAYGSFTDPQSRILSAFARSRPNTYLLDTVAELSDDEEVPYDGHPGITGHARFAEELYRFLLEKKVIPCALSG